MLARTRTKLAVMSVLLMSACSISDVGEVAARKTALADGFTEGANDRLNRTIRTARNMRPEAGAACSVTNVEGPAPSALQATTSGVSLPTRQTIGTAKANLIGLGHLTPSAAATSRIEKNDVVSIRLRSVFLSGAGTSPENVFSDFGFSASALGETTRYFTEGFGRGFRFSHNLEVLIAVNAFDYGSGDSGFRFDQKGRENAKVIYYSDDVNEDQFLSFDNLPILGPVTYTGAGLGLQLYALEIDAESEQQKALLQSLATVGSAAAGITGPGAGVLNTLTSALLDNGNTDDRIFEYAIGFDTGDLGAQVDYVPLEENLYAFVADFDRQRSVPWERIALNSATGELMECNSISGVWQYLDGFSYMVVQILKGYDGQPASQLVFENVGDLTKALREERSTKVSEAIDEYSDRLKQKSLLADARVLLGRVREGTTLVTVDGAVTKADIPRAQLAVDRLAAMLTGRKPGTDGEEPDFGEADFDYVLTELYEIAVRANGGRPLSPTHFPAFDPGKIPGSSGKDGYRSALLAALGLS